jgi:type II secretory pathway component GspD/PulD (secretin)
VAAYLDVVHERVQRQVQIEARVLEVELNDEAATSLDWNALLPPAPALGGARPSFAALRASDLSRFMMALEAQGTVTTLANPRVLALNNEAALVRAVDGDDSFTLAVTPQITAEGIVTLSLSPAVTLASPSNGSAKDRRPAAVRESDMLARVADGETIVTAGFTRERTTRERKAAGNKGGWFGRSTVVTRRHIALVILLTPRIVSVAGTE